MTADRDAFEAWFPTFYTVTKLDMVRNVNGYRHGTVDPAWEGWKAGTADAAWEGWQAALAHERKRAYELGEHVTVTRYGTPTPSFDSVFSTESMNASAIQQEPKRKRGRPRKQTPLQPTET